MFQVSFVGGAALPSGRALLPPAARTAAPFCRQPDERRRESSERAMYQSSSSRGHPLFMAALMVMTWPACTVLELPAKHDSLGRFSFLEPRRSESREIFLERP